MDHHYRAGRGRCALRPLPSHRRQATTPPIVEAQCGKEPTIVTCSKPSPVCHGCSCSLDSNAPSGPPRQVTTDRARRREPPRSHSPVHVSTERTKRGEEKVRARVLGVVSAGVLFMQNWRTVVRSEWTSNDERVTISAQVGEEVSRPRPWTGIGARGCALR
jgi:hypothetical protein